MSQSYRVAFSDGDAEETVVVKLASDDPTSRGTGVGMGAYCREVAFYRELAGADRRAAARTATSPSTTTAEGWFTLVLEDIAGADAGRPDRRLLAGRGARSRCARWRGSTRRCSATSRSAPPTG